METPGHFELACLFVQTCRPPEVESHALPRLVRLPQARASECCATITCKPMQLRRASRVPFDPDALRVQGAQARTRAWLPPVAGLPVQTRRPNGVVCEALGFHARSNAVVGEVHVREVCAADHCATVAPPLEEVHRQNGIV